jgi:hypothetical protein
MRTLGIIQRHMLARRIRKFFEVRITVYIFYHKLDIEEKIKIAIVVILYVISIRELWKTTLYLKILVILIMICVLCSKISKLIFHAYMK